MVRGSTVSHTGSPPASTHAWDCGGGERNPTRQVVRTPQSRHSTMTASDRCRQPCPLAQRRLTVVTSGLRGGGVPIAQRGHGGLGAAVEQRHQGDRTGLVEVSWSP